MIPKIIHYGWFGDRPKPIERIDRWKKMLPDWEFKEWNESNVDTCKYPFAKRAYELKKYGPALDFWRMDFLYEYGGVWLDADVEVHKDISSFLSYSFFIGYENPYALNLGTIGSEPQHSIIKKAQEWLVGIQENILDFNIINKNRFMDLYVNRVSINCAMLAALRSKAGFIPNGKSVTLKDNIRIEDVSTFTIKTTPDNYIEHLYEGSWREHLGISSEDWIQMLQGKKPFKLFWWRKYEL